ncbi:MAG TPA: polysaccharide deacetylase family protein [Gemmatimonadales bacterium]
MAAATGVPRFLVRNARARGVILAYHNVVPDADAGRGDRSLHLPLSTFRGQLDLLQQCAEVVPLMPLLDRETETPGVLRAAVTFDDAYRGAIDLGLAEVVTRGLPATVFVAPSFLGGRDFWWDVLAAPPGELAAGIRDVGLGELGGDDESIRSWAVRQGLKLGTSPDIMRCSTEIELRAAAAKGRVTLASHTWSHRNLRVLEPPDVDTEVGKAADWVRMVGGEGSVVAYPYGLAPRVTTSLAACGHRFGLLVAGGRLRAHWDTVAVPRINVPAGLSPEGLLLRLSGLMR